MDNSLGFTSNTVIISVPTTTLLFDHVLAVQPRTNSIPPATLTTMSQTLSGIDTQPPRCAVTRSTRG
jgi:predicted metallo-beta-lactamase superfamily hydrolase